MTDEKIKQAQDLRNQIDKCTQTLHGLQDALKAEDTTFNISTNQTRDGYYFSEKFEILTETGKKYIQEWIDFYSGQLSDLNEQFHKL